MNDFTNSNLPVLEASQQETLVPAHSQTAFNCIVVVSIHPLVQKAILCIHKTSNFHIRTVMGGQLREEVDIVP